MDVKKKKLSAWIAALVMIFVFGVFIAIMVWGNIQDPIPLGILLFFIAIFAVMIIGIIIALVQRIKEIQGGEEDAAGKY